LDWLTPSLWLLLDPVPFSCVLALALRSIFFFFFLSFCSCSPPPSDDKLVNAITDLPVSQRPCVIQYWQNRNWSRNM
jgi:hypothetical protein